MKHIFTILIFTLLFAQSATAQSQKTFVKSLTLESNEILADLDGTMTVSEWDKDFVRITATVNVTNFSEEILKRLFIVGRYSLEAALENEIMVIRMPKLATKVTIKGKELKEKVSYQISVPRGTIVHQKENNTLSVVGDGI